MENEKIKKLNYITENIIEKGYNPEVLSNFIIKKLGIPMDRINFEQLKKMIELFKDQSLQDTYQTVKIQESNKKKEESPFNALYSPESYNINTHSQQKNKLLELEEKKQYITIKISEPKKEKSGGLFSKAKYSYRVETDLLKTDVRRTYNDFEWLREQLFLRYPLRIVAPIIKENSFIQNEPTEKTDSEEIIEQKKVNYLNKFINKLIQKKILRTSPILLEFLELNDSNFKKYRDFLIQNKYELDIGLDNLKTLHGKIQFEMRKEDIKNADNLNRKYTKLSEAYQKIEKSIINIYSDFKLLENHMNDISSYFMILNEEFSEDDNAIKIKNIFSELNKLFSQWSVSYGNQWKFFKNELLSIFRYMNLETQEMSNIYKNYINFKNEYEDFTARINKKKEELFEQKDYSKWSLEPGTESQIPMIQNNKKIAFEKMLYKETFLLLEEKKRVACSIHFLFKEYNKMIKHQSKDLEDFLFSLKEKEKLILGDALNLIKIFSIVSEKNENPEIKK